MGLNLLSGFYMFLLCRTILLSVISLFNEPNTSSPANVDASVMYRRWKDSKGKDAEYANIIKKQVGIVHLQLSIFIQLHHVLVSLLGCWF